MMVPDDVRERIASYVGRYVIFRVEGDVLRWRPPKSALSDDDRAWLTQHKYEVIAVIAGPDAALTNLDAWPLAA